MERNKNADAVTAVALAVGAVAVVGGGVVALGMFMGYSTITATITIGGVAMKIAMQK